MGSADASTKVNVPETGNTNTQVPETSKAQETPAATGWFPGLQRLRKQFQGFSPGKDEPSAPTQVEPPTQPANTGSSQWSFLTWLLSCMKWPSVETSMKW